MTTINKITYRQSRRAGKGAVRINNAQPELAGIKPLTNRDRLVQYLAKLDGGLVVGRARAAA